MPSAPTVDAVAPTRPTGQQARIEKHATRIANARRRILDLTLERATVESALATFEHEYGARVGSLYGDLDRVQLEIKELLYRARLVEKGTTRTQEHLDRRVENAFRRERARVEAAAGDEESPPFGGRGRARGTSRSAPADTSGELRQLYLRLAKRYHPDKSHADNPAGESERLMGLINDAYEAEDVRRLRQIAATLDDGGEPVEETGNERERRLFHEALDIDRAARDVERDVDRLKQRNTYTMMCEAEEEQAAGRDLLGRLRADLASKLDAARERMSKIRSQVDTIAATGFTSRRA